MTRMIVIVAPTPENNVEADKLEQFLELLGQLPDGVRQVAKNVLLVDPEAAPDFLLKVGQIAARARLEVHAYSSPTPPAE